MRHGGIEYAWHGLLEKLHKNALVAEFQQQGIPYTQHSPDFRLSANPYLIVFDKIIVDTKAIEKIGNNEKSQIINYLKITGLRVGLLLNFRHAKLEWERIIL